MLNTPLGDINIYVDGIVTDDYEIKPLKNDKKLFPNLDGRFALIVDFKPDGRKHIIECRLENHIVSEFDCLECGENVSSVALYAEHFVPEDWYGVGYGCKISIAVKYELDYDFDGYPLELYDYGFDFSENGYVAVLISENTKTDRFVFGVAWKILDRLSFGETFLGADPTLMKI